MSSPEIDLVSATVSKTINEIQIKLALDALEQVGLLDEFEVFYEKQTRNINEALKEFAENHPDKLHVPQINEMYGNICVWQRD